MNSIIQYLLFGYLVFQIPAGGYGQNTDIKDEIATPPFRVTLIGTGAPPVDANRMGPSILVEVGDHKMLFDAGRGASINIGKYELPLADITAVFLTHLHGDHVLGLSDLWLSSYHKTNGHRQGSLPIYGPEGLTKMTAGLESAYAEIIDLWGLTESKPRFEVHTITKEDVVFEDGELRVTAFRVNHGEIAYGFKIEYGSRSVVISGDTGYSENLINHAQGTDLLLHEIFFETRVLNELWLQRLKTIHTLPETAADIFLKTRPKVAVGYHIGASSDDLQLLMHDLYDGTFYAGEDLMSFDIDKEVRLISR